MLTACKQYYLAAGATQGNIACTQTVMCNFIGRFEAKQRNENIIQNFIKLNKYYDTI